MIDSILTRRGVGASLALSLMIGAVGCSGGGESDGAPLKLPPLSLSLIDHGGGAEIDLGTASSAPRVINLWATWCAPCRAELPAFDAVATAAGASLDVLGVNVAEDMEKAEALVAELGLTFPQAVDPDGDLSAELEVTGLPATIFATTDGEIVEIHTGPLSEEALVERVDELFEVTVGGG